MKSAKLTIHGGRPAVTVDWQRDWPFIGREEISAVVDLMERGVL